MNGARFNVMTMTAMMRNYTSASAGISQCKQYRYWLMRAWKTQINRYAILIGLNPSIADGLIDDPTIRRDVTFAKSWGCDALIKLNLFAYRATDPAQMLQASDPVGPDNDWYLHTIGTFPEQHSIVVAAWGNIGNFRSRENEVKKMLAGRLHYLRLNKNGSPAHTLYLPSYLEPKEWLYAN